VGLGAGVASSAAVLAADFLKDFCALYFDSSATAVVVVVWEVLR
jgi:hypothetical protein